MFGACWVFLPTCATPAPVTPTATEICSGTTCLIASATALAHLFDLADLFHLADLELVGWLVDEQEDWQAWKDGLI